MPSCFVPGCKSGYQESKGKHFFTPPKDEVEFSKWVRAIPRKDKELSYKCYVCDSHFSDELIVKSDSFVIEGKQVELPRERWMLKPGAVPHVFPNLPKYLSKSLKKRKSPSERPFHNIKTASQLEKIHSEKTEGCSTDSSHGDKSNSGNATITSLKKNVKRQDRYVTRLRNKMKIANARISVLEKQFKDAKLNAGQSELSAHSNKLSKKQKLIIDTMIKKCQLKNKKGMRYDSEFLLDSLLLKIKSPKGYRHCLRHDLLPLPSESHLRHLVKGLKCPYGINSHALEAIKTYFSEERGENKRLGTVIFDEVKLKEEIKFNNTSMKVDGFVDLGDHTPDDCRNQLANHALVFMFVPLLHNWVQPVAIYASRNATPGDIVSRILMQVIIQLEQAGARIVSFTSDGSQSNKKVWKCLGISGKEGKVTCSVSNPFDGNRRIWAFSDAVHVMKCIRNNFHDKIEVMYNNEVINYNFYRRVYELDSSPESAGLKVCHKLTSAHLDPSSFQRMNVRLAFQLFSNSVANGIQFLRDTKSFGFEGSELTETFTRDVNCLADALNSSIPKDALYRNSTAHETLIKWKSNLTEKNNTFASERTLQSLRVTIESTLEMSEYLWKRGFSYVLTAKFNQDPLERHFGILRSLSCDDHPSTIDFLNLHMLQSIYIPTKQSLSLGANCEYKQECCLTSFVNQMRMLARDLEQKNKDEMTKVENIIKQSLELQDTSTEFTANWGKNVPELSENSAKECLVYYLGGYIVKQATKFTTCEQCVTFLRGNPYENKSTAILTFIRDYGSNTGKIFLTHPSKGVFSVFMQVESVIVQKLSSDTNLWGDLFFECLDSLDSISVQTCEVGCCEEHVMNIIPKLVLHYMKCRFFFYTKQLRKELRSSKSYKSTRKLSKLSDN